MLRLRLVFTGIFFFLMVPSRAEIAPELFTVEVSATVTEAPPQIRLQWPADSNATGYSVSRKSVNAGSWTLVANLGGGASGYVDSKVAVGTGYEYQILKTTTASYTGSGYIFAGIKVAPVENRGAIILLVDGNWASALAPELNRLEQDLTGDGWKVIRQDIARGATVPQVKSIVRNIYYSDPSNVKALFLFGKIPVPYSGNYCADSHENHTGAWPADTFYGDMDGSWTDSSVYNVSAEKYWNHNVPGDGKYDQSEIPSDIELEVGRVDLSNMTCFSNKSPSRDELALLRQYLNKDHAYRHAMWSLPRRGLISYNYDDDEEALRSTPMRNYAPLFGPSGPTTTVAWGNFFPTLNSQGFLMAYGAGGGGYYTCAGVGGSDDFAVNDIKAVFAFFFGSYFGDWDNESSFLRAPLGSTTYTLASSWFGRPHWFLHHMALGGTIGYATRITQNNRYNGLYQPQNLGTREVHAALMGDPTLRLHTVRPAQNLKAVTASQGMNLSWGASSDANIVGYFVYRGSSLSGPFTRISGNNPYAGTSFSDSAGTSSSAYMVRVVKLEASGSGTYYNLSQGVFAGSGGGEGGGGSGGGGGATVPAAPSNFSAALSGSAVVLTWKDNSADESGFNLYRSVNGGAWQKHVTVAANTTSYQDSAVSGGAAYLYSLGAFNSAGESLAPNTPGVTVPISSPPGKVTFAGFDRTSGGTWKGRIGREGFNVIEDAHQYPSYASVAASGAESWVWNWTTSDAAGLQRASDSSRLAACWYSFSPYTIRFNFQDTATHRLTAYFLDWDQAGRVQNIDLLDNSTGAVLWSQTLSQFENGVYAAWDVQGGVTLRIRPVSGNGVISGYFFDPAGGGGVVTPTAAAPVISPNGGSYSGQVLVSMTSATSGAQIRYTLDGSAPNSSSPLYGGAFYLTSSATVKAQAFRSGYNPSPITSAAFTISTPGGGDGGGGGSSGQVSFKGLNTSRQGTWKGAIGKEGYVVIGDAQSLPSYAAVTTIGKAEWVWEYSSGDPAALQRAGGWDRLAACWYSDQYFDVKIQIKDGKSHRVALYCLDWDYNGRKQKVQALDGATGKVLHTYDLANFINGSYLEYNISGSVVFRFTKNAGYNSVLSGIFFDAAK